MEAAYDARHRVWTTSNGAFANGRQTRSPGVVSIRSSLSEHVIEVGTSNGNGTNNIAAITKYSSAHSSDLIGVQSKFRRKYYHKALLGTLILLILLLMIAVIVISLIGKPAVEICNSKECVRAASTLLYSMNDEIDPCNDFYEFTCGRWAEEHPRPDSVTSNDWFRERQTTIMRKLRDFLRSNISGTDPKAVVKAKTMYAACMDTDLLDKRELEPLVRYILIFDLPIVPRGLNLTLSSNTLAKYNNTSAEFNWLRTLGLIKEYLALDLIIGFDIFPDPLNRTINRIALGTPETDTALPFNKDDVHKLWRKIRRRTLLHDHNNVNDDESSSPEEEQEESAKLTSPGVLSYIEYVRKITELYVSYVDPEADILQLQDNAEKMAIYAVKVARKLYRLKSDAENTTKSNTNPIEDIVYVNLVDLQNETDKLIAPKTLPIWHDYLSLLLNTSSSSSSSNNSSDIETNNSMDLNKLEIMTSHADIMYLQTIVEYLLELPSIHLEFYIWLYVVEELILHTTSEMRLLHTEYMRQVVGTESSTPRSLYCAHSVNTLMGMAVSFAIVNDTFTQHKLPRVKRMLNDIRSAFDHLVSSISWMDEATKQQTLQKSAEMRSFIGFPEWITNTTKLDEHYANIIVNRNLHLENMIEVLHWQMIMRLENINATEPIGWATAPTNVNAFHTFQSNAITVPIAILQYPFYDLGLETLNYGSIGSILGHELTHGFDDSGRMFDKDGNMLQWWTNETISEYVNRTECFVEQYSSYLLPDIGEYIDGELTLGENIADNGGMREAYHAYQLYAQSFGGEDIFLPGLEQYNHEQLFFIAFGNLWCETYTPSASRYALEDSHCPGKFRLRGVLTNSEEFATAFNCPIGSPMNPNRTKCRIW